jgi:hypothetical protein
VSSDLLTGNPATGHEAVTVSCSETRKSSQICLNVMFPSSSRSTKQSDSFRFFFSIGAAVVMELCFKPEGSRFETR